MATYRADVLVRDGTGDEFTLTYWDVVDADAARAAVAEEARLFKATHPVASADLSQLAVLSITLS